MRSNKEQLDIILQRKQRAEATRAMRRKVLCASFSLVLCLCATVAVFYVMLGNYPKSEADKEGYKDKEGVMAGTADQNGGEVNNMGETLDKNEILTDTPNKPSCPPSDSDGDTPNEDMYSPSCKDDASDFREDDGDDMYSEEECLSDAESIFEDVSVYPSGDGTVGDGAVDVPEESPEETPEEESVYEGEEHVPPQEAEGDESPPPYISDSSLYSNVFVIDGDSRSAEFIKKLSLFEENISYLEGRENMGLAMAWMLHINGGDAYYHTVIRLQEGQEPQFTQQGRYIGDDMYYFVLSYSQVIDYASNGYKCLFVGSGLGNDEEISTETKEGIEMYCQIYGDMLVADKPTMY